MRYPAGVALLVVLCCCTACGGSMALDPVAAAAAKTHEQGGRLVMKADMSELPDGELMTADGTFDAAGNVALGMTIGAGADATDMRLVLWHDGDDIVMFMKSPDLQSNLPEGKTWMRIDLTKAAKAMGLDPDAVMEHWSTGSDPTELLDMLGQASGGVEKLGAETVAGVETTHYRASIDLAKLAREKGVTAAQAERLRKTIEDQQIPVDVWVDGDGYLRRLDEHMTLTMKGETKRMSLSLTIPELGDFTVEPPSEGVADMTDEIASSP